MKKLLSVLLFALLFAACQSPKEKALEIIKELEGNDSAFNSETLNELTWAYMDFADKYPDDAIAPTYLFKAAQRNNILNKPQEALQLFDKLMEKYPNSEFKEEALFLKAFTYENNLRDFESARQFYTAFLKHYPKSELAEDAKLALENLGKSPEELLEIITKKNAAGNP